MHGSDINMHMHSGGREEKEDEELKQESHRPPADSFLTHDKANLNYYLLPLLCVCRSIPDGRLFSAWGKVSHEIVNSVCMINQCSEHR